MPSAKQSRHIDTALQALARVGVVPNVAAALVAGKEALECSMRETVLDEIPAFTESHNPDILPEFGEHASQHVAEISRLLSGSMAGDFEFVREHARRRAEQRFPLEATLHAYRCGHKIVVRWVRDAALATADASASVGETLAAIADFAIEYTDTISTIATSEYVAQTRRLGEAEGDRRTALMSVLLGGYDESDGRVAKLLRSAGYLDQRQSFCVAVAQSVDPKEMENPARVRRLTESIDAIIRPLPIRSLIGVRDNQVTIVFSDARRFSGWTEPQTTLSERVKPELFKTGNAILIGLSTDAPSTSHIPKIHAEAQTALALADVSHRVVGFSDIPIRRVLLWLAKDEVQSTLPHWSKALFTADDRARGTLSATLRAYADADMNVLQAARFLSVHPNTIYSRMQRLEELTGLDGLNYHALNELLLATDCRP